MTNSEFNAAVNADIRALMQPRRRIAPAQAAAGPVWRDIPGFEGRYEVSDTGLVRTIPHPVRTVGNPSGVRIIKQRLLAPSITPDGGHLQVNLGRGAQRRVHRLVALAFIGPAPHGYDCAHLNGNPTDNRVANLAYVTRQENNRHVAFHGRRPLTVEQVRYIRSHDRGIPTAERNRIAGELGITRKHVNKVLRGETYGYV